MSRDVSTTLLAVLVFCKSGDKKHQQHGNKSYGLFHALPPIMAYVLDYTPRAEALWGSWPPSMLYPNVLPCGRSSAGYAQGLKTSLRSGWCGIPNGNGKHWMGRAYGATTSVLALTRKT